MLKLTPYVAESVHARAALALRSLITLAASEEGPAEDLRYVDDKFKRLEKEKKCQTHCKNGHEKTPENVYVNTRGWRLCRICIRSDRKRYMAKHPEMANKWYWDNPERARAKKKAQYHARKTITQATTKPLPSPAPTPKPQAISSRAPALIRKAVSPSDSKNSFRLTDQGWLRGG